MSHLLMITRQLTSSGFVCKFSFFFFFSLHFDEIASSGEEMSSYVFPRNSTEGR